VSGRDLVWLVGETQKEIGTCHIKDMLNTEKYWGNFSE
jgi:hypothetical protein